MVARPHRCSLLPCTTLFRSQAIKFLARLAQGGARGREETKSKMALRSEEHTSELQSHSDIVCGLLLEKKKWATSSLPKWKQILEQFTLICRSRPFTLIFSGRQAGRATLAMSSFLSFFFNDTATTEIYTLSLHDALPISIAGLPKVRCGPIEMATESNPTK